MDADELELPDIPASATKTQTFSRLPFVRLNSRKRSTRSDELVDQDALSSSLHTSSDPALFSSDETPDADNYCGGKRRKKKTYAGTWWGDRLTRSQASSRAASSNGSSRKVAGKRKFTRNFDSGIFMNSDDSTTGFSSDSSFGNELLEAHRTVQETKPIEQPVPTTPVRSAAHPILVSPGVSPQARTIKRPTLQLTKEQRVVAIVRECLDQGKEDVDLSDMQLETLPLETRELATMVKEDPATEIHFDSLVARPRLYLANNLLRQFPTPLLELRNLRLLSIRQNKLVSLPPGIRDLAKLETLNISGNRIHALPIEVLDLMVHSRLSLILSDPNPWQMYSEEQADARLRPARLSTRPAFHSVKHYSKQPNENYHLILQLIATSEDRPANDEKPQNHRQFPSLTETVLRQLSRLNNSKRNLTPLMAEDTPSTVSDALTDLHTAQIDGDRRCAWCKRLFVRPSASWIEWWNITSIWKNPSSEIEDELEVHDALTFKKHTAQTLPFELGICGGCA